MQRRLTAIGLRPISALVDITNYLTYGRARPLHVYDTDKLTGDIHVNWVNDLQLDFQDPKSPLVGTELVGTSMSSSGNGGNVIPEYERAAAQNDFVKWYNSNRGYVTCELTPDAWTTFFRVTPFVDKPGAPILTKGTFVIEEGQPGANEA